MTAKDDPLVSCICITHNAVEYLKKSVQCFQQQTYPHRELIVAFSSDNIAAANFVATLQDTSIKTLVFPSTQPLTLGEKRNLAINYATGFYFCVWDDDDWHNVNRISACVTSLAKSNYPGCALSNLVLYDGTSREAYLSATRWGWEATLFCQKSVVENPEFKYRHLDQAEDSPLVYDLKMNNLLLAISQPELYIYIYHGKNTFRRDHWDVNLLQWATKLPPEKSLVITKIINNEISPKAAADKLQYLLGS